MYPMPDHQSASKMMMEPPATPPQAAGGPPEDRRAQITALLALLSELGPRLTAFLQQELGEPTAQPGIEGGMVNGDEL